MPSKGVAHRKTTKKARLNALHAESKASGVDYRQALQELKKEVAHV